MAAKVQTPYGTDPEDASGSSTPSADGAAAGGAEYYTDPTTGQTSPVPSGDPSKRSNYSQDYVVPESQRGGAGSGASSGAVETLPIDGSGPSFPSPIAPPNTPTSLGTFALPGTSGSAAFRSPNFAMNRGLGKDIAGAMGKRKRFSEGVPVAAQTGQLTASARKPEDWADSIAAYLAGR